MWKAVEMVYPYRRSLILLFHAVLLACCYLLAYVIRSDFRFQRGDWELYVITLPIVVGVRLVVFALFRLYEGLWRYASIGDMLAILKATTLSTLIISSGILAFQDGFPRTVLLLDWLLCITAVAGIRLAVRVRREASRKSRSGSRRVLIVGAGDAGEMLIREIERNASLDYEVVGFVDDDRRKLGTRIHDVEVFGVVDRLADLCLERDVREVFIAIPSAKGEQIRRIIHACQSANVEFRTLPGVGEMIGSSGMLSSVRRVQVADLLRRDPVRIDRTEVEGFIRHKRVLVTGAGGSIGSELCRQVAGFEPESLVLLDQAENSLFFVDMELRARHPKLNLHAVVGDVTDECRMGMVFQEFRPQIVFHAAAHKHVPLMESNRTEAVKNNVIGTMIVANAAWKVGAEDFVMISTDKAVRPTSIMGATKRVAEMYVQSLNARIETRFMTVRFGNVLGSEGSVVQVFQRQIEAGGPVTVTHPEMMRYFMTIPEACQLVLQAATQGKGGEIFLLDMGEPVRIVDLAKDLITLMGLEPGKDIELKFTGVRPGEKIFEELLNPETRVVPTLHEKIMVVETTPIDFEAIQAGLRDLIRHAGAGDEPSLVTRLAELVPDYRNGKAAAGIPWEKRMRVLLAEDDPYTRMILKRILENSYQVYEVENGRQVARRIKECEPHLIILNHNLPGANVRRLCEKIKAENGKASTQILILAESDEKVPLEMVRALGADDRVYKPIPVHILEKRVDGLLKGRRGK